MKDVPKALVFLPAESWRSLGIVGRVLHETSDHARTFVLAEASGGATKRSTAR